MSLNNKTTKIKGDVIVHGKIILKNGAKIFMTGCVAPTAYPFLYPVKADLEKKEGMHIYGDLVLENETWLVDGSVLGMVSGQMKAGSLTKHISKEELENFMSMSYDERILSSIISDAEKCMALTSEQIEWLKQRSTFENTKHGGWKPYAQQIVALDMAIEKLMESGHESIVKYLRYLKQDLERLDA